MWVLPNQKGWPWNKQHNYLNTLNNQCQSMEISITIFKKSIFFPHHMSKFCFIRKSYFHNFVALVRIFIHKKEGKFDFAANFSTACNSKQFYVSLSHAAFLAVCFQQTERKQLRQWTSAEVSLDLWWVVVEGGRNFEQIFTFSTHFMNLVT